MILLITYSCKKDPEMLTIKGSIAAPNGSTADVSISVYGKKVETGTFNASFQKLISGNADASGNFSIEIEKENISEYKITISKYRYFTIEEVFYSGSFKDDIFNKSYTINPSADINIVVKNVYPNDNTDYFKYTISSGYINAVGSCSEAAEFKGTDVDEEYDCKVIGFQDVVFEWVKAKNGVTSTGTKTVYCDVESDNAIEFYY